MIVDYTHTARRPAQVLIPGKSLYTYITAANGLYIQAERENLAVQLPLNHFDQPVRGIEVMNAYVNLPKLVPLKILGQIIQFSQQAMPREALFYIAYFCESWQLIIPDQIQTNGSVRPVDNFGGQEHILIEIHSHNRMEAFFSTADDADETGFRIYGVLGRLDTDRPEIKMRVGVYGHFIPTSYKTVFGVVYER